MAAAEEKFKRSDKEAKAIKDEIDSIVKDLTDSGYDLSKEATKRAVGKGKTAALNALGVIGAMTLGVSVFSTNKKMIGTKYKLKDEKKKKTHTLLISLTKVSLSGLDYPKMPLML